MTVIMNRPVQLGFFTEPDLTPDMTLAERYEAWIGVNPWVLDALERLADQAAADGAKRIGMKHLVEILRWKHRRSTHGDTWKLNNSYTSRLARDLIARRPDLSDLFETRELRSA